MITQQATSQVNEAHEPESDNLLNDLKVFLCERGFSIEETLTLPAREAQFTEINDLQLEPTVHAFLDKYSGRVYQHQHQALKSYKEGKNVCLATSTSSGKSDVFFMCGIDLLSRQPKAKILAVYPLKALGNQQEERWQEALNRAGLNVRVGRIDGSVGREERMKLIADKNISVIIVTPDVIHAWLLAKLEERPIQNFLRNVQMVVLDEVHTYSGVFGSNSAFLYRRLLHAIHTLSAKLPQFITASATVENPNAHLEKLTSLPYEVIDLKSDTSGKHNIDVLFLDISNPKELLGKITHLIHYFTKETDFQSITFLDSRKMVEQVATIVSRLSDGEPTDGPEPDAEDINQVLAPIIDNLPSDLQVFPYRSGYELEDAEKIQKALKDGTLGGVVSTSALEMGIDIKDLNLGILLGIPTSSTSFYQRIGRIGRHKRGIVLIINDHSVRSTSIFKKPKDIFNIPLSDCALYLENEYLQYIHTLCYAASEQEYDKLSYTEEFTTPIQFPDNFIAMCQNERNGIVPTHLRPLKTQIDASPQLSYPLRDLEPQFRVEENIFGNIIRLGSLSFAQVMREAYPGAVYYYMKTPYRVKNIIVKERIIRVCKTRYYNTKPIFAPILIFPNFTSGNIYYGKKFDDLQIVECALQIRENIVGVKEKRGNKEITIEYPFSNGSESFPLRNFTRNYFSSGFILSHPILNTEKVQNDLIAQILYEVFLTVVPFERQDISYGKDKFRADKLNFHKDERFVCVFDQTYGSLRLTSRLTDIDVLQDVFNKAIELVQDKEDEYILNSDSKLTKETINALCVLQICLTKPEEDIVFEEEQNIMLTGSKQQEIILPYYGAGIGTKDWTKSKGVSLTRNYETFYVSNLVNYLEEGKPKLYYRGYFESDIRKTADGSIIVTGGSPLVQVQALMVQPTDGSATATYDLELQDIVG